MSLLVVDFDNLNLTSFLQKSYILQPLEIACDISAGAVVTALNMLKFNLNESDYYHLYITRRDVEHAQSFLNALVPIKLHIDETCPDYFWYLVDNKSKTIVYSPGC